METTYSQLVSEVYGEWDAQITFNSQLIETMATFRFVKTEKS
jgi:hypothetical protein